MSKLGLWKAIGLLCVLCAATAIVGTFIRFGGPKAQAGWRRHPFVMSAILPGWPPLGRGLGVPTLVAV
jgi:hypothetical protein